MATEEYSALKTLVEKKESKEVLVRAESRVEGSGPDATITLTIKKRDLERARPGRSGGPHRGIGFRFVAEFELPDEAASVILSSAWMTLAVR